VSFSDKEMAGMVEEWRQVIPRGSNRCREANYYGIQQIKTQLPMSAV